MIAHVLVLADIVEVVLVGMVMALFAAVVDIVVVGGMVMAVSNTVVDTEVVVGEYVVNKVVVDKVAGEDIGKTERFGQLLVNVGVEGRALRRVVVVVGIA
mmetsp:Transcript_29610/g.40889  ORF Transcript_29610/g.40889 Transcript_29610/m.40889 type:complete len:100 (-) Transcript_29610:497-796(-)|eukprot:CAMPEP_0201493084 /NCGR_PEP_ID=MMETSP0151_2-20130828/36089_1 /ASSEMBLY_ACC=CAM_ASM_000257 /TAXON_ID=200890 /ORGANISM="Paramoeba atlantica, Strain 621/1 / CCAP 1560/9" /LENGTH=99 /DNA_ID=CAMNT_0047880245 /DNA_START=409 /DNA_END=708 /DNA_ORIENTATION=-